MKERSVGLLILDEGGSRQKRSKNDDKESSSLFVCLFVCVDSGLFNF